MPELGYSSEKLRQLRCCTGGGKLPIAAVPPKFVPATPQLVSASSIPLIRLSCGGFGRREGIRFRWGPVQFLIVFEQPLGVVGRPGGCHSPYWARGMG
jgi:hypothetical protein